MNKTVGLALLLAMPTAAAAQEIPSIVISKPPQTMAVPSAVAAAEELADIPGGVEVVTDASWEAQRATTVKDMLEYVPGVFAQPRNGAEASRLSIRGSGLARQFQGGGLLVLQDGVPINTADGSFDFQEIDPWLTRYAEVYRGANALKYGASNLGGAINFVTPTGRSHAGTTLRAEGGSFGTFHGQASQGSTWETGDAYATAIGFSSDGFRGQNTQHTGRLSANLGWQLSPEVETRFYFGYTGTEAEIPGTLSKAELFADPDQAKPINAARDYARDLDITRLANVTAWQKGATRYESTLYGRVRSLENPVFTYISSDARDLGWRGSARHTQERGEWLGGVNLAWGDDKEQRFTNNAGEVGNPILTRDKEALTTEAYLQYSYFATTDLTLIGSAQVSYARRRLAERTPTAMEQTEEYAGFNPRVGVLYDVTAKTQLFSNLSRSFEPPELGDLSNGNDPGFKELDAQTATTIEFGGRGSWRNLRWDAAYYHAWVEDEFIQFQFPNGTSDTINAGDTTREGVEIALAGPVAQSIWRQRDALDLRFAYQWNHFRLKDDPTLGDRDLPGVPEHYLRGELYYSHPAGWGFGPNVEWVPDAPVVDLTNTLEAQSYALLGARAAYAPPGEDYEFYIEARNLLDKTYIATYDVQPDTGGNDLRAFYPGDGRAFYAGMRLKL